MATDLTPELRAALAAAGGGPLELVDPLTNEHFFVVRSADYAQLKSLGQSDEWDAKLLSDNMARVMQDDWDDPALESYQEES